MYEDWSAGCITEYNFNMLSEKYQNEQKELETKIRQLHETMEAALLRAIAQRAALCFSDDLTLRCVCCKDLGFRV